MKIARIGTVLLVSSLLSIYTQNMLVTPTAQAESFVAAEVGYAFPQSLMNGKVTQDQIGGLDIFQTSFNCSGSVLLAMIFSRSPSDRHLPGVDGGQYFPFP